MLSDNKSMILHIFNYGLEQKLLFDQLIQIIIANPSDNSLLLMQNGIYCGLELLNYNLSKNINIYLIANDVVARGLLDKFQNISYCKLIDYHQLVDLVMAHPKNINWKI